MTARAQTTISCGAGRCVINPEIGHPLAGYGQDYPNEGVHDDISVTAVWLESGDDRACLLSFDLVGMERPLIEAIRLAAADKLNCPPECVFLANTHNHSGPEVRTMSGNKPRPEGVVREAYNRQLAVAAAEAALAARDNAEECHCLYNYSYLDLNMNRRYHFPNRESRFIPLSRQLLGLSNEYVDRELGMIVFRKTRGQNKYKAIITNYTAHPLCIGNSSYLISADYQGFLRKTVEETFAGCLCLTTTGAAGDQHPLTCEAGIKAAERMGETLGTEVIRRAFDAIHVTRPELRTGYFPVALPGRDGNAINTFHGLLGIGPILLAGLPGELVACLGAQIKVSSPFLKSYVMMTATDNISYLPARNQFLWGGYEVDASMIAPGAGERLVDAVLQAAETLLEQKPLRLPATANWTEAFGRLSLQEASE